MSDPGEDPIKASQVKPESIDWLWRNRIPRKMLTIVGGRPDQRKGLFCTYVAAEITRTDYRIKGKKETRKGRVLYSAMEDSHSLMTRPRLDAAGADLDQVDLWRFRLPLHYDQLMNRLLDHGPYDMLVMDPFASHLSTGVSRHSDNVRTVTDPLIQLLEATGTACVIVEHVLKKVPASGHPIAAIGGTGSGLIAAARMGFLFGIDPGDNDRSYLCCVKHNICQKPSEIAFELDTTNLKGIRDEIPSLIFDEECEFDPLKMLQGTSKRRMGRPPDKRAAAGEWLAEYLYAALRQGLPKAGDFVAVVPGPVPAARVFEDGLQFALSNKTLRRAASDLEVVKEPASGPYVKWSLPPELVEVMDEAYGFNSNPTPDDDLEAAKEDPPLPSERKSMTDMAEFEKQVGGDGD